MSRPGGWTLAELVDGVLGADARALARAITLVEDGDPLAYELVRELYPATGRARSVGMTGPPGVGKSSLISSLVAHVRGLGETVGVISVDPSSPLTRGALLGDRIRLADHFLDPGVFIRSMGTRGHAGGLAEATLQALLLVDASGKRVVFLETVGTGQNEVGVASIADVVVLVLQPGSGDSVQALKAGIMEIPDVIAVNKSDQAGAETVAADVKQVLALGGGEPPPVVLTDALTGAGVADLWTEIGARAAALEQEGTLAERRRKNVAAEVFAVASARARRRLEEAVRSDPELARVLEAVEDRRLDPLTAVRDILERVFHLADEDRTDTR